MSEISAFSWLMLPGAAIVVWFITLPAPQDSSVYAGRLLWAALLSKLAIGLWAWVNVRALDFGKRVLARLRRHQA